MTKGGFTDRVFHKTAPVPSTGRPSIYDFRQPLRDWFAYLFDTHVRLPRDGRVLDAGCGPGAYVPAIRDRLSSSATFVALDINHGRLSAIDPAKVCRVAGDVVALPFPDRTFDVVLAMHMLYHVGHVPDAVSDLHRILRPGSGVLYAFTNSDRAQWELVELWTRHGGGDEAAFGDPNFSNESGGAKLRTAFGDSVELIEMRDSELVVTDSECIVDEFERLRYALEAGLRPGATWAALIDGVREEATRVVATEGAFRISENHGLFICRRE